MEGSSTRQTLLDEDDLAERFDHYLRTVMRIPQLEHAFSAPWPPEARAVLPSHNPKSQAAAVWAPVLGWLLVRVLAEYAEGNTEAGVSIFDHLRLRSSFAEIFASMGLVGEDSWRAAARIRIALLLSSPSAKVSAPGLSSALWEDSDVRWLTGLHASEGILYFNKEAYEEVLWWTKLPDLADLAGKATVENAGIREVEQEMKAAISAAKEAGYKLEKLLAPAAAEKTDPDPLEEPTYENSSDIDTPEPEKNVTAR